MKIPPTHLEAEAQDELWNEFAGSSTESRRVREVENRLNYHAWNTAMNESRTSALPTRILSEADYEVLNRKPGCQVSEWLNHDDETASRGDFKPTKGQLAKTNHRRLGTRSGRRFFL